MTEQLDADSMCVGKSHEMLYRQGKSSGLPLCNQYLNGSPGN